MWERDSGERDAVIRVQDAEMAAFPPLAILMIPLHLIYTCGRMLAIHTSKDPPLACPRRLCAPGRRLCLPPGGGVVPQSVGRLPLFDPGIRNLVAGLRAADVAALGLDALLEWLGDDNDAFATRYGARLNTRQTQRERGTLSALLGQINQSFDAFCQIVAALLLTQQDAATQTALEQIASQINALVRQYDTLNKRHASVLAAKKKTSTDAPEAG